MGGSDEKFNLVLLTLREHYVAHALLVKITEGTQAYYKMCHAFILMGGRTQTQNKRNSSRLYEKCKKEISKAVSNAHSGTMVVKDANTGIRIGRVRKDHPKILSGEWIFFHKGMKRTDEYKEKISNSAKGAKNGNAIDISNDVIIKYAVEFYNLYGKYSYPGLRFYTKYMYGKTLPKSLTKYREPVANIPYILINEHSATKKNVICAKTYNKRTKEMVDAIRN